MNISNIVTILNMRHTLIKTVIIFFKYYRDYYNYETTLIENVIILKTESLEENMHQNGWKDFNIHVNKGKYRPQYDTILDNSSIELIREFYKKDFEIFG